MRVFGGRGTRLLWNPPTTTHYFQNKITNQSRPNFNEEPERLLSSSKITHTLRYRDLQDGTSSTFLMASLPSFFPPCTLLQVYSAGFNLISTEGFAHILKANAPVSTVPEKFTPTNCLNLERCLESTDIIFSKFQ
ncbi:hypothetical protein B5X24_HaOG204358 [Helicoverpa armigera]|uniref:Uncharacterized protein n=1 Tax=Helicoverpa armigera TaxID=29058 RepID=A0A2W1BSR5_HELAM|nr:hypothetical protein B5X24_HaOG204358 [Helicoverpa armigera]